LPKKTSFVIDEKDNVATILQESLEPGEIINVAVGNETRSIEIKDPIRYGHKIAISPIKKGEKVLKYGICIGVASKDIGIGEHAHIQNVESVRGRGDLVKGGSQNG